tara:strand:- start:339 stop:596 length:258 start_codon:yes stop_codon:yes gene_type:complete
MGDTADTLDNAEKAGNFLTGLLAAAVAHPYAFVFVMASIAFVVAFLPNGPVKAYIDQRTELKKLENRVSKGRQKLTNGRQNRRSK